jgi:hypothetical protein
MASAKANSTPIVVRVPMNHVGMLWFHSGTVRYGFPVAWFFNELRARYVPVRFWRHRYGTVHPSIRGCTRTTPVPADPYRRSRTGLQAPVRSTATARRVAAGVGR